jgi:hypothetical protein
LDIKNKIFKKIYYYFQAKSTLKINSTTKSNIYYHSHAQLPQLGEGEKERDMNMKIVLKVEWVKHEG